MSVGMRQFRALLKLRAVAGRSVEAAARSLKDLEQARAEAGRALDRLEAAIRLEETIALGRAEIGFRDFAAYLTGAAAKREAIIASCRSLEREIAAQREVLAAADLERRQFDHLVDQIAVSIRQRRQKAENARLDDAGRRARAAGRRRR